MVVALVALLGSGSRGGILSFGVSAIVLFVMLLKERPDRLRVLIAGILICATIAVSTALVASSQVKEMVLSRFSNENAENLDDYTSGRTMLWTNGLSIFWEKPLFGHGQDTFIPLMNERFSVLVNSHNDYILELATRGVVGLFLFLFIFWRVAKMMWNNLGRHRDPAMKNCLVAYLSGLSGYLFAMLGVNLVDPTFLFWIYTAAIYVLLDSRLDIVETEVHGDK